LSFLRLLPGLLFAALLLPAPAEKLSPMARAPDWSNLNGYQRTITRADFTHLINDVYAIKTPVLDPNGPPGFWAYTKIDDDKVTLFSDPSKRTPEFTLHFAPTEATCLPRPYRYHTHGISNDPMRPLKGLKIALDPGHIGGDWARLEGRYFKLDGDPSVEEAKLNLITCQILAERLEADGASIIWAKHGYEPTTDERPDTLHYAAIAAITANKKTISEEDGEVFGMRTRPLRGSDQSRPSESQIEGEAALLFYRVAEIRARAELVNEAHPDLTICVHYNADDWDDPDHPKLIGSSKLIIFVNGSYERSELVDDDIRYDMMRKLLDRDAVPEIRGCSLVGHEMLEALGYPPEAFAAYFAHRIGDVPSVYTRNLLANRLYHGPVIYCEGPYMNAYDAYYRIIAGDYLGTRVIHGQRVPSIYRTYALAVERGVLEYFNAK
jgi:N-acetylmuramoyl-L-alanine amidase